MNKFVAIAFFIFCFLFSNAQTQNGNARVTGTLIDADNKQPVGYASVTLANPQTDKPVNGALAGDNGKFSVNKVEPGTYKLMISFVGYETKTFPAIQVKSNSDNINLGSISLKASKTQLKEVVVQGQRAMFEEKVDRTVYNAENDISNKGGDATDVLRKVPMLSVDLDGNVSLRGSQNIKVLINNRPSTITAGSVADALKQIPSDLIKSVEVITSPSAKYDAEGTAGIINIITKKNTLRGGNLNIDLGAGLRGSNLGLRGSYKAGKMGFSLGGFGRAGYNTNGSFENIQTTLSGAARTTKQAADTKNNGMFGRYSFGWDYDINEKNFLTTSLQYGLRNFNNYQDGLFRQSFGTGFSNQDLRDVESTNNSGTFDIDANFTHTFKKPEHELSVLTQFSQNNQTNNFFNAIYNNDLNAIDSSLKNINESFNRENTIQLDYQNPITKTQILEMGAKQIIRKVTSDFETFTAGASGAYQRSTDVIRTNAFNYDQRVSAGYLSYTLNTPSKFSIKTGLRYEHTTIDADFKSGPGTISIPAYGVFVPSVNLSQRLKSGNTIKLSYNRRISRPSLQFLNPNRQSANPLNITVGNPNLDPEHTNNFELGYNAFIQKTSLNFSVFARNTNNAIESIRQLVDSNAIRTTFDNIGTENTYGLSVHGNVNLGKLSFNTGMDTYYAVLKNNVPDEKLRASNSGMVYNIRGMGTYTLGKGWGLQAFGFYRAGGVQLQGTQGGFGIYSLNLRSDINNKRGTLGFGAENFFGKSITIKNTLTTPDINQSSIDVRNNLSFRATFSYRIGKITADQGSGRRKKSVSNDDLKGGGDSGGGQDAAPVAAPAGGQPSNGQSSGGSQKNPGSQGQRPGVNPAKGKRGVRPSPTPDSTRTQEWKGLTKGEGIDSLKNQPLPNVTPDSTKSDTTQIPTFVPKKETNIDSTDVPKENQKSNLPETVPDSTSVISPKKPQPDSSAPKKEIK